MEVSVKITNETKKKTIGTRNSIKFTEWLSNNLERSSFKCKYKQMRSFNSKKQELNSKKEN